MDSLRSTYNDDELADVTHPSPPPSAATTTFSILKESHIPPPLDPQMPVASCFGDDPLPSPHPPASPHLFAPKHSPNSSKFVSETEEDEDEYENDVDEYEHQLPPNKKLKSPAPHDPPPLQAPIPIVLPQLLPHQPPDPPEILAQPSLDVPTDPLSPPPPVVKSAPKSTNKKSKKKNNNVWTRPTSRKGKKKAKNIQNNGNHSNNNNSNNTPAEERVFITPIPRFPDKNDDCPETTICLSKFYKAEKVEISEDRLTAGSSKGYRMVRATRGVVEGAWYFEIKVLHLGETGHTRLGWSTDKGDLQAPVGFDANSFGYRDIDGSKVHKALREKYGEEGYKEGDVIGFYINLPEGSSYAPDPPRYVWYKGQRYVCAADTKDDPLKVVPGSEICFFKNGICQGTAFKDLYGGRYYPAASMYTLPDKPNCLVRFNFGPDFEHFPEDFGGRLAPRPMIEVPYHGFDGRVENGNLWNSTRMSPMLKVIKEQGAEVVEASKMDIN